MKSPGVDRPEDLAYHTDKAFQSNSLFLQLWPFCFKFISSLYFLPKLLPLQPVFLWKDLEHKKHPLHRDEMGVGTGRAVTTRLLAPSTFYNTKIILF